LKEKLTKQVLISKRLIPVLHIAAIKSGKSMREFLDEMVERELGDSIPTDDDITVGEHILDPPPRMEAPPDDIGSVSLRVSVVEDPSERTF
jgi:hypothetical protein